jgi:hypothetical protein
MIRRVAGSSSESDAAQAIRSAPNDELIDIENGYYDPKDTERRSSTDAQLDVPILGPANNLTNIIIGMSFTKSQSSPAFPKVAKQFFSFLELQVSQFFYPTQLYRIKDTLR